MMKPRLKTALCVIGATLLLSLLFVVTLYAVFFCRTYQGLVRTGHPYCLDGVTHDLPCLGSRCRYVPLLRDDTVRTLKRIYRDFESCLERWNVRPWISGGTLIGCMRHGGFVPWDDDMDLHMCSSDRPVLFDPAFQRDLADLGLTLMYSPVYRPEIVKVIRTGKPQPFVDVLFEARVGDRWGTLANVQGTKLIERETWPEDHVFPLQRLPFEDMEVWGPGKPLELIRRQYGSHVFDRYVVQWLHCFALIQPLVRLKSHDQVSNVRSIVSKDNSSGVSGLRRANAEPVETEPRNVENTQPVVRGPAVEPGGL